MENPKLNLSLDFQNSLLNLMFVNEVFALKCISHLSASYFENKYLAWIFEKIKQHHDKYKTIPSRNFIVDQLKVIKDPVEQESYKKAIKAVFLAELTDTAYIKDEVTTFIQTCEFKKLHATQVEMFNSQQYKETYALVSEHITRIQSISFDDDSYVKVSDINNILEEVTRSQQEFIPTGIPDFDKALDGGLPKESVTTVLGAWNTGKSIFSINLAYYAAKLGNKKVLYVFHEGRKSQVVIRFLARITGIPYNHLMAGDYRDDEKKVAKLEEAKKFIAEYIRIREMRTVGVSVEDVYLYCKQTMKEWPFDVFIDDYGAKLTTSKNSFREIRHVYGHIWNVLDLMSAELKIAVITLAQLNREAVKQNRKGNGVIRSEGVSEAAQINHISETIFTLNKSSADEANNKLIVCLDKCRSSQTGLLVECTTDFRSMRAYDPVLGIKNAGWDLQDQDDE